jgi:hypothetical protein
MKNDALCEVLVFDIYPHVNRYCDSHALASYTDILPIQEKSLFCFIYSLKNKPNQYFDNISKIRSTWYCLLNKALLGTRVTWTFWYISLIFIAILCAVIERNRSNGIEVFSLVSDALLTNGCIGIRHIKKTNQETLLVSNKP